MLQTQWFQFTVHFTKPAVREDGGKHVSCWDFILVPICQHNVLLTPTMLRHYRVFHSVSMTRRGNFPPTSGFQGAKYATKKRKKEKKKKKRNKSWQRSIADVTWTGSCMQGRSWIFHFGVIFRIISEYWCKYFREIFLWAITPLRIISEHPQHGIFFTPLVRHRGSGIIICLRVHFSLPLVPERYAAHSEKKFTIGHVNLNYAGIMEEYRVT